MYASEKGCFFDGIIETMGDFDLRKLKVKTMKYLDGEDTIVDILYDDVEIENEGGETTGKSYSVAILEN